MSSAVHGPQRPPLGQMTPQERRDYLALLDPASRRQAEAIYIAPAQTSKAAGS